MTKISSTSRQKLQSLIDRGQADIRLILAPPRTGSTLVEALLFQNYGIQASCHEPFVMLGYYGEDSKDGYRRLIEAIEKNKKNLSAEKLSRLLKRLPNNLHVSVGKIQASDLFSRVKHIAMSSGSACSSNSTTTSHVLAAIGLEAYKIKSSVRIGIGHHNTEEDITSSLKDIMSALKSFSGN